MNEQPQHLFVLFCKMAFADVEEGTEEIIVALWRNQTC